MILDEGQSRFFLDPNVSLLKLDETESSWLEAIFKVCENLAGGLNTNGISSLESSPELEEELWNEQLKYSLILEVKFRTRTSKAKWSKQISNEGFEVGVRFDSD